MAKLDDFFYRWQAVAARFGDRERAGSSAGVLLHQKRCHPASKEASARRSNEPGPAAHAAR